MLRPIVCKWKCDRLYSYSQSECRKSVVYSSLVYTTQVNSTFRARWLASSEAGDLPSTIHLRAAEEKQNGFCQYIATNKVTLSALRYSACVVYTKTIFHLSVGESDGYKNIHHYPPPLRWIIVNYWLIFDCPSYYGPCCRMQGKAFISKYFNTRRKPASYPPLPTLAKTRKETFDVIYYLYKVKEVHWLLVRSKELRLVEEDHATVKPGSSIAPRGLKTYSESRFELQNLKTL